MNANRENIILGCVVEHVKWQARDLHDAKPLLAALNDAADQLGESFDDLNAEVASRAIDRRALPRLHVLSCDESEA